MLNIDSNILRNLEKSKDKKKFFSRDILLSNYLKLFHNIIEFHSSLPSDEVARFINSLNHLCNDRGKSRKTKKYSLGDIVEVEFGLKYASEISYRHSGVVIKDLGRKIFIVPTTSNFRILSNAYHPIDKPNGHWYFRKVTNLDGFDHDCALILNDACIITKNRIMSNCGVVKNSALLNEIKNSLLNHLFEDEINEYKNTISQYEEKISELSENVDSLNQKLLEKQGKIGYLYSKIDRITKNKKR